MSPLLARSSLRSLLRHPWQAGLAVVGVALGVSVAVAIDLANASARRAFALSTEATSGRATHQVVGGPAGLPDALFARLVNETGLAAAPVVEDYVSLVATPRLLHLLGVDAFSEEDAWDVVEDIPANSAAAVILLEHRWAIPVRDTVVRAGGFRVADGFISPLDLVAIGLVAAEEAEALASAESS